MNPVLENINTRVSVREYTEEKVPEETIMDLLKAGFRGPNAMNRQALAFAVVENRERAKEYSDRAKNLRIEGEKLKCSPNEGIIDKLSREDFNIFFNSPVQIFIFASPDAVEPVEDASIAAENIMLAAHSMGLGSCFIGFAQGLGRDTGFRKDLGVPDDHMYLAAITLGRPAGQTPVKPRKEVKVLGWIR
ncbi:MAG: nitroreductase family protein [Methanomassiliicoccaceae archaeon]|nr:nitroreductase family protein [Methanomassiliicoccaceae archaeon]